jgi:Flp pilus assembly protein TadG
MRFLVGGRLLKVTHRAYRAGVHPFLSQKAGNVAMSFALLAIPLCLAIGASVDYVRAFNTQARMQADLDAALIMAIKEVDSLDEEAIKADIVDWFNAQADTKDASYTVSTSSITVSKADRTVKAVVHGSVPTTFMGLANIKQVNVAATSSVAGPATSYLNVYLVLDKSASMLLASTKAGQDSLIAKTGCTFACHEVEGGPWTVNGVSYNTHYKAAKAMGVQLRADVSVTAAKEVLTMIDQADPSHNRIKVGLYKVGTTATQVLAPTYATSTALSTLTNDGKGLNSATSEVVTSFDTSLPALTKLVGVAGDGSAANSPLKLVLLLTDGVQSERDWVVNNPTGKWVCTKTVSGSCIQFNSNFFPEQTKVTPLEPSLCEGMKENDVTMGVLYTEYLSIPLDWGYNGTVGDTMKSSSFSESLRTGVSKNIARRDYIPYALEDCASSSDMFLSASDPAEIEEGLSTLFEQYLGSVRLTQ